MTFSEKPNNRINAYNHTLLIALLFQTCLVVKLQISLDLNAYVLLKTLAAK